MEGSFEEIARDFSPNWMTSVEILDISLNKDISFSNQNLYKKKGFADRPT